jgi:hypothetical protein
VKPVTASALSSARSIDALAAGDNAVAIRVNKPCSTRRRAARIKRSSSRAGGGNKH